MPPAFSIFTESAFKFVVGFGLAGGAVWKGMSMIGGEHHDHQMMGNGVNAPAKAQEAERLVRRFSTNTNIKQLDGDKHPEAIKA